MKGMTSWVASAVLLSSAFLAACGVPASGTQPSAASAPAGSPAATAAVAAETAAPAASAEPVTLRVAWWGSPTRNERTLEVIKLFEQAYPHIKVAPEYAEVRDYWPQLNTEATEGKLPDVMQQDYAFMDSWVSQGNLLSLNPYVASGAIQLDKVADEQLSGGRKGEKLYGISLGTNAITLIYDPAKFKAAGVAEPTADWTWKDFEQAATTIHQKLGIYGVERFSNYDFFNLYLKEHGQSMYNQQGSDLGYTDDVVAAQFFQMLVDMQASGAMTSMKADEERGTTKLEESMIVTGEAAMKLSWSNQAEAVAAAAGRELALVQTPRVAGGSEGVYLKPSMFFSIPSTTKHPDEAALFINFFLNSPEANAILAAERGVPIVPKVRTAIKDGLMPMQQQVFKYISEVESVASPLDAPPPPFHSQISSGVYGKTTTQVLNGELSPADAAAQIRSQAADVFKSAK